MSDTQAPRRAAQRLWPRLSPPQDPGNLRIKPWGSASPRYHSVASTPEKDSEEAGSRTSIRTPQTKAAKRRNEACNYPIISRSLPGKT